MMGMRAQSANGNSQEMPTRTGGSGSGLSAVANKLVAFCIFPPRTVVLLWLVSWRGDLVLWFRVRIGRVWESDATRIFCC